MAITQALQALSASDRMPLAGAAVATILAAVVLQTMVRWGSDSLSAFPHLGKELGSVDKQRLEYVQKASSLYAEGYRKFKDGIFRLTTARIGNVLVISPKYLPELQKLPDNVLSFTAANNETLFVEYTEMITEGEAMIHTIKSDLTPALNRLNPTLAEEVEYALNTEIGDLPDWSEINIHSKLLRIVAIASGRIFVGQELSRTEAFIEPAIGFTVEVFAAVRAISAMTPWKRRFWARSLPEIKRIRDREREGLEMLRPIVAARLAAQKDPSSSKPDDFLQWAMDRYEREGLPIDELLMAKYQLNLSLAAIHTTTMTTTNALYTLATMPDFVPELREEIRNVLAANGGTFTTSALQQMKKLDSFIRENMRCNHLGAASFNRKVLKPIVLSTGEVIPAGVCIEVPAVGVNRDSEIWSDAHVFDPLRYYKLRQEAAGNGVKSAEVSARNQTVSVNTQHLTFGFGRHACPGRFFAANEMKMILSGILLKYDVKLVGTTERYPNIEIAGQNMPDPTKMVLLRNAE